MTSEEAKNPPNLGVIRIGDDDMEQVHFWIRMFNLEGYVEVARLDLLAHPNIKGACVPILAEYRSGKLFWFYAILLFIDRLGFTGATGLVTYADEKHRDEALKRRDHVADLIMGQLKKQTDKGKMTGHMLAIEPGKEELT